MCLFPPSDVDGSIWFHLLQSAAVRVFHRRVWLIADCFGLGFWLFTYVSVIVLLMLNGDCKALIFPLTGVVLSEFKKKKISQWLLIWESVLEDIKYLQSFCELINHDYCFKRPYILSTLSASPAGAIWIIQMCLKALLNPYSVETIRYVVTHQCGLNNCAMPLQS